MTAKTILITGATSGIGLALFELYVARGDKVIACGRNAQQLNKISEKAHQVCQFDVNQPNQIQQQLNNIDKLDVVIFNAGDCQYIDDVKHFEATKFAHIISTNLTSLGWLLEAILPKVKTNGQLVFVSSSATILPFPRSEAYGASKAGMDYLANSLRLDLAAENIDVTLVHPGFVKTPLTDKNDFNMPFLITSDQAAKKILKGVNKRQKYLHFPKRLTLLLKLFSFLPSSIWQKLMTNNNKSKGLNT
ncbi:SDR family NAD(P)-dependent oxidoreductase [Paraglaciecola aquimarina]|uniref:SDR family NAD(P)-dependent oxidoreductase n=1 Tax=Paraglaciecola algarum TaxID=3050085 RepID=A0ABS9DA04_9ALTE|nr:SDR family NAD(P)-dependent oxidoreductase [Paraglaciecola sp. G1-23]MCF2949801.1 SDR family NAD(P)-dependent oxidoreductase [Paraglaciecola sp. G1-23]